MKPYTATDYEVRAFLEKRKTQFRVPVEPQPEHGICECPYSESGFAEEAQGGACRCIQKPVEPPYKPGDRIEVGSITLEVENVRVQKLQDISEDDANREGVACSDCWTSGTPYENFPHDERCGCVNKYANLWNERHPTRPWDANPWVWIFDVKVV